MRRDDIKLLIQDPAIGPRGFVRLLAGLLEGRDEVGRETPKLSPSDVSVRGLWEGMLGPCEETLPSYMRAGRSGYVEMAMSEAIDSSMFPNAMGMLIASEVIAGYDMVGMIGDLLVRTMKSTLKNERIVGFTSLEGPLEVTEGRPYEESSFGEKFVTTETAKKGRILEITEEAIFFDQTGQLLMRASRLGEMTREEREITILAGVVDVGSGVVGYKDVYRPSGNATPLYSTGNTNHVTDDVPLTTWSDIDVVLRYHAENVRDDRALVEDRRPIPWRPVYLLTARKKAATAGRVIRATEVRTGDPTSGDGIVTTTGNPLAAIAPGLTPISSPYLDFLATLPGSRYDDSDDWFMGDFKKQFVWQEIWPLQTLRAPQNDEAAFRRDIVARFKVRYYGGIAALDNKHVVKVNAAT